MSYYQKNKKLIDDDNEEALHVWEMAQPLSEQLAITQTIKDVLIEILGNVDSEEKKYCCSKWKTLLKSTTMRF